MAFRSLHTGLRVQIAATIAGIVIAALAVVIVAVHLLLVENRIAQQRGVADTDLVAAQAIYRSTGLLSFDARIDDPAVPAELRRALSRNGSHGTVITGGAVRDLWAAGRVGKHVISIHRRFRTVDASVAAVDRALLVAGASAAIVATAVGALSASRLSRRLRLAARTARGVAQVPPPLPLPSAAPASSVATRRRRRPGGSATDSDEPAWSAVDEDRVTGAGPAAVGAAGGGALRRAVGPGHDEVGDLADAVDAMADRLADRLRAEQRFTADVAHDLRTPLTGLTTAAELLDDSRPAQMVRDRTEALTRLVEELLEVARLDSGVETAQLEYARIGTIVDHAVQRGIVKSEFPVGAVTVAHADGRLDAGTAILTDPRRLERVLSNLIRNALQHGRPPVEIVVSGDRIELTDHGPGFDPELLASGPQRFQRRSSSRSGGHGLGLVIAVGQTAVLGGRLEFSNAPGGGARVTIDLPGAPPGREPIER